MGAFSVIYLLYNRQNISFCEWMYASGRVDCKTNKDEAETKTTLKWSYTPFHTGLYRYSMKRNGGHYLKRWRMSFMTILQHTFFI